MTLGQPSKNSDLFGETLSSYNWLFLPWLRRRLCKIFAKYVSPSWPSELRGLIDHSLERWSEIYSQDQFRGRLKGRGLEDYSGLFPYLRGVRDKIDHLRRREPDFLLEHLILPYLMTYERTENEIRLWFPESEFIDNFREVEKGWSIGKPNVPLYPYFKEPIFDLLRVAAGTRQTPIEIGQNDMSRLQKAATGMRSLQTKLIGTFEAVFNPQSRFEDQLVGNASAWTLTLVDDDSQCTGMIFLCSPVFRLFHELLLVKRDTEVQLSGFHNSFFLCTRRLAQAEIWWPNPYGVA